MVVLVVANGPLASPGPAVACPSYLHMPDELNGTFDLPLGPGACTIFVESCSVVSEIVITETIPVVTNIFLG